jgi:putative ABC transport system permease protein
MNLWIGLSVGLKEIAAHKFRSALTMLGIILGVCSLVGMFALVAGMTSGMEAGLNEIGGLEKINVIDQEPPQEQEHIADLSPGRTLADVEAIRANCPLIGAISPEMELRWIKLVAGARSTKARWVVGAEEDFLAVQNHEVEHGRFLADLDQQNFHRVCVIGTRIRDALFPVPEGQPPQVPLGEQIDLNGQAFTVVGVLRHYETEEARKKRAAGVLDKVAARAKERRSKGGQNVN